MLVRCFPGLRSRSLANSLGDLLERGCCAGLDRLDADAFVVNDDERYRFHTTATAGAAAMATAVAAP